MSEQEILHMYVSTYCQHQKHTDCRLECKTCKAACLCPCHDRKAPESKD